MALLKEVMVEEEERSEFKGHSSSSSVPAHGKQPKSGSSTLSGGDHSEEEDIDANVAIAGMEGLVIEGGGGGGGEEDGERQRELSLSASDASSSGDDDDDNRALSSLIRCLFGTAQI